MKKSFLILLMTITAMVSCKSGQFADLDDGLYADIKTNKGDMLVKLEYTLAPVTVANFVSLAEGKSPFVSDEYKGKKYYDGIIFHRVMKDFMIQGGDPTGTGMGSPGYKFKDEFTDSLRHTKKGILSMANSGPKTNGSQFFITHAPTPFLDGLDEFGNLKNCDNPRIGCHTVFGEVIRGIEVVDSIAAVKVAAKNRPLEDVIITTIEIVRKGKEAKKFDAIKVMTAYFDEEKEEEKKQIALAEEAKKTEAAFAAETAEQIKKAETLPSGLKVLVLNEGTGEKPRIGQKVLVNYAGWLSNGTLFDTSLEGIATKFGKYDIIYKMHGNNLSPSPMDYSPEARLAAGFKEGLLRMKVGDKVRLFIPPHLGYGELGAGPIPPNSDLIFDVEITGIQ